MLIVFIMTGLFYYNLSYDFRHHKKYKGRLEILDMDDRIQKYIIYKLTITNFDTDNKIIKGRLTLSEGLGKPLGKTLHYSKLIFYDMGESLFPVVALKEMRLGFARLKLKFSKNLPPSVSVNFRAIGNPEYYPFDSYIIAGIVKCYAYEEVGKKKKFLNLTNKGIEVIHIKNLINNLFLRKPNDLELKKISNNLTIPPYMSYKKSYKIVKGFCNYEDSFILIGERPKFLKLLTILMGLFALFAAQYIGFKSSTDKFFINIVSFIIGVWGIRSIILGNTHLFLIYLDYYILGLYLFASVGFILRLLWGGRNDNVRS